MSAEIRISDITTMAMSESFGLKLRQRILDELEKADTVILNFENITLFATPFFNASVGYLYMHLTPDVYRQRIITKNMNPLGDETYRHSIENAEFIYSQKSDVNHMGKIVEDTIKNS